MKKNNLTYIFATLLGAFCLTGCGQDDRIGLDATDSVAPGVPTNIQVENINGGAIITYTPPKDDDLLCVTATYMINGIERSAKASPYVNHLKVEGFGKVADYEVILKSIDKSRNESTPVTVTVTPLTPPVEFIYESMKVVDSFGGVSISWENPTEDNIIVEVYKNEDGEWVSLENFYSSAKEGTAKIRGLEAKPITLGYRIRDRWDNYSQMLEQENTPIYEEQLDKSLFRELTYSLPGDCEAMSGLPIRNIWQGNDNTDCFHNVTSATNPAIGRSLTFDMGQVAKVSRFKMYQRRGGDNGWAYTHNNLKRYIVYGATEITEEMENSGEDRDGIKYPTFEGWTKILEVECYKPSGANSGIITNEDLEYIVNGDEHEVPLDTPPFRYVRLHMLENWSGGTYAQIGEMTFWGSPEGMN